MKIAIVGAGIVGVATAWELAADGHEVTVFERHGAAAEESSFGHGGLIAPSHFHPWAAPGLPGKALRNLLRPNETLRLAWPLTMRELGWFSSWRRASRSELWQPRYARVQQLAFYSRQRLHDTSEHLDLQYDRSPGVLVLMRTERERKRVQASLPLLQEAGVRYAELSLEGARAVEPALNADQPLAGALHLPDDGVANCRQFALLLKREAQARGVRFAFNHIVQPLERGAPAQLRLVGPDGPFTAGFDAVVLCGGVDAAPLLRPLGIRLPLAAVHGYSVSAPTGEPLNAPRSAVIDERWQVTVSRLGQRVRVSGGSQIGGPREAKNPAAIQTLYKVLQDWFPAAAQLAGPCVTVQEWKGASPTLPDGAPVLGASGVPGVWLNLGHGASGWSLACGSARAVADQIAGRAPEVDLQGLDAQRLFA